MDTYTGTQQDPASLHKYLYVHANPVMYTDPSGNITLMEIGIGLRLYAIQLTVAAAPALYTINHIATRLGTSQLAMAVRSASTALSTTLYRGVGLHPNLLRLHAGQMFERIVSPAMRLLSARPQFPISVGNRIVARADWLWQGRYVIDAKLGQSINLGQLAHFARFASQNGGSVTYVTLTRSPPDLVQRAQAIGNTQNVAVNFISILPF
jgi:hypothetical protein